MQPLKKESRTTIIEILKNDKIVFRL